jgi:L-glyceraldehyde 3-phosphate reductase
LAQGLLTDRYLEGIPADSRMGHGRLSRVKEISPALREKLVRLNDCARQRGQTLAEMALAWCLRDRRVTSVIVGVSSKAQLETDLKAISNTTFSPEELADIDGILQA